LQLKSIQLFLTLLQLVGFESILNQTHLILSSLLLGCKINLVNLNVKKLMLSLRLQQVRLYLFLTQGFHLPSQFFFSLNQVVISEHTRWRCCRDFRMSAINESHRVTRTNFHQQKLFGVLAQVD
jgi:hypothetical protein